MDKQSGKSIDRRIKTTFIIIVLIMSLSFIYSNIMKNKIVEEYNDFMKVNIRLSDLSVEFTNSWSFFDSYMKTKTQDSFDKYMSTNDVILNILDELDPYVKKDKDSSIYYRNLIDMFEWQILRTRMVIAQDKLDLETYDQLMKIRTMNFYISQHSSSLLSSYLQYTDSLYTDVLDKYKLFDTNIYGMLIFTVFINVFLIKVVNDDIIRTINDLSLSVKQLPGANWDIPDIEVDTYRELNNLTTTFNHMKNSLTSYINELNEKSELEREYQNIKINNIEKDKIIRETQLKALQMQMNPHFLFNNLNTVSRMAMFENAEKTVDLIDSLSKILRYNLSNRDNLVPLKEEIENVKAYILIQKIKYEDRITFNFNIDENMGTIFLPPMTIQLLVENAINHGFNHYERRGQIDIKGKIKDDFAIFAVEDNGKGILVDDLIKLKSGKEIYRKNNKSTGLGIRNIRDRLELYFNRHDLLFIESKEGLGTKISFLIPIKESEEIAKSINSRR